MEHIPGKKKGNIVLYALSTCGWCAKTRNLLKELGVEYSYEYVDLLDGEDQDNIMNTIRKWNPACSFPTMVINNNKCVIGFKEDEIRKELQ
jgi:glutaredoxin-like protein NrdH